MADTDATPLTQEERAELEELRAEKARREEEERARRERAELEQLRAERARAEAASTARADPPAAAPDPAASAPAAKPRQRSASPASEPAEPADSAGKSFGVRMVTSDTVDKDGIPTMPVAQKILIAVALVGVVAFFVLYVL